MPEWWEAFKSFISRSEEGLQGQLVSAGTSIYDAFEDVRKQAKATINKVVPEPVASAAGRAGDRLAKVVESEKVKLGMEFAAPLGPVMGAINRLGIPSRAAVAARFAKDPVRAQANTQRMSEYMAKAGQSAREFQPGAYNALDEVQKARAIDVEGLRGAREMRRAAGSQAEMDEAETMIERFEKFLKQDTERIGQLSQDLSQTEAVARAVDDPKLMDELVTKTRGNAFARYVDEDPTSFGTLEDFRQVEDLFPDDISTREIIKRLDRGDIDPYVRSVDLDWSTQQLAQELDAFDIEELLKSIGPLIR